MDRFPIGHNVEVKGFGEWLGTTLLGHVSGYFEEDFYIVTLWCLEDPDLRNNCIEAPGDDAYYLGEQEQYRVVHRHLVRYAVPDQPNLQYNIGDIVDWNDRSIMRKGVVVRKQLNVDGYIADPNEQTTYTILVDQSNELEDDYSYRVRLHVPWL